MTHESGNQHEFLLTLNGACALSALLDGALSGELPPNDEMTSAPTKGSTP